VAAISTTERHAKACENPKTAIEGSRLPTRRGLRGDRVPFDGGEYSRSSIPDGVRGRSCTSHWGFVRSCLDDNEHQPRLRKAVGESVTPPAELATSGALVAAG